MHRYETEPFNSDSMVLHSQQTQDVPPVRSMTLTVKHYILKGICSITNILLILSKTHSTCNGIHISTVMSNKITFLK